MTNRTSMTGDQHASIWDTEHRALTIGSILAFTVMAFQGLAMSTVAPVLADSIGGKDLYGWIFTAFLLPQIVGTVYGGREVDRHSPARVFLVQIASLAIGTIICGAAPNIWWLFGGRALQGFGAGGLAACIYAVISSSYADRLRPAILAATSAAWVVPSIIGPAISGYVAENWSWRWAFVGLLPVIAAVVPLTWPAYRTIPGKGLSHENDSTLWHAVFLALGTGVFLSGLELQPLFGVPTAIVGAALMVPMLTRLLPVGVLRAKPVVPATILARGIGFGGFAVIETYMILALKEFGGVTAAEAGITLTLASLFWTAGSWVQSRWDHSTGPRHRPLRILIGFSLVLIASTAIALCVAVLGDIWLWVGLVCWSFSGFGIGMAYPTAVSMAFSHAEAGQEGRVSSAMLLSDLYAFSVGVGLGGVLLAIGSSAGWSTPASIAIAMAFGVVMLAISVFAATRLMGWPRRAVAPA